MSDEVSVIEDDGALEERVFTMRRRGSSIQDIAKELDLTDNAVVVLYNAYRMRIAEHSTDREEAKMLMRSRYDALLSANFEMALMGDADATKTVLSVMRDQMRLEQLDQLDPRDSQVTQNILVIGNDRQAFLEALRAGRQPVAVDERIDEEEDAHE